MRTILLAAAIAGAATLTTGEANAQYYPYCAAYSRGLNCGFTLYAQCAAVASRSGGWCQRNFYIGGPGYVGPKASVRRKYRRR
jgi:uncharacterized protein DUF3551